METAKIAELKMRCLEMAERICGKHSEIILSTANEFYAFLDITFVNLNEPVQKNPS